MVADIHRGTLDHNFRFLPGSSARRIKIWPNNPCTACIGISKYGRNRGYDRSGKHRSIRHFLKTLASTSGIRLFPRHPSCMWESPVLPVDREIIGRATPVLSLIEVMRFCPGFTLLRLIPIGISPLIQHRVGGHIRLQTTTADADDTGYNNTTKCEDNLPFPVGTFFYIFAW